MSTEERFDAVLTAARTGAEWAWTEIYRDLSPVVLGYLRGQRAPNPEDLVSEIFLQVVRDLDRFSGNEANFRSWLFTIAHHRLIDARRKQQRRPSDATEIDEIDRALPPDHAESEAVDNLTNEEIRLLFEVLSEDQRAVLLLRVMGGLTIGEIAEIVDKRPNAVKALQRRGINALRAELARHPYPVADGYALTELA